MKEFEIEVGAMVTIHENEVFCVKAETYEEAKEKAVKAFSRWLEEKFAYVDYDEVVVEGLVSETDI